MFEKFSNLTIEMQLSKMQFCYLNGGMMVKLWLIRSLRMERVKRRKVLLKNIKI